MWWMEVGNLEIDCCVFLLLNAPTFLFIPIHITQKLIKFLVTESARVMKGTIHEEDFYFYHDALSLMTAKETRKWMCEKW